MSWFAGRGLQLQAEMRSVVRRWRGIRSLVLVDSSGLPLASSLGSMALEERLAAPAAAARSLMVRSQDEVALGPIHCLHLSAQDRQIFCLPVDDETLLAAIVEADANAADIGRQLATTARRLLADLPAPDDESTSGPSSADPI